MTKEQLRQAIEMFLSWVRVFLAASLALYSATGVLDWNALGNAGFAAVLPVILRWLDPMDKVYGRGVGEQ